MVACLVVPNLSFGQVSLTGPLPTTYTQDFNTLAISGNTNAANTLPSGWLLSESGTNSDQKYRAETGSSGTGDVYSVGANLATERALGGLRSGNLVPVIGATFTNNSGTTITEISISYIGEQWRLGSTGRNDRLDFQYSIDATSLITGSWIDVNTLDFAGPISTGSTGQLNGNLTANKLSILGSITGLSIANGSTFYIRWNDLDATGSDDVLSVDDFSITAIGGPPSNTITTSAISGSPFSTTCSSGSSVNVDFTSTGTFNAGNVYTAQLSDATGSFTSPTIIGTLAGNGASGTINATIPTGISGSAYRIRVVSNDPVVTGSNNGVDLTINYTCTISTDAITGSPFTTSCSSGASVTVPFTASSNLLAGNVYTAQLSNATGSFTSPTVIGTLNSTSSTGSITATIPSGLTGTGYRIRVVSSNPTITGSDNGSNLTLNYSCTITTGTIIGSPFAVTCFAGATVDVPFTSSSAFATGNIYTAQISNAAGSFASPVNIGTLSSTATSGNISATIPASTSSGTGYRIRVVASNPAIIGSNNGTNLTVNYSCPSLVINEIYIDADLNDGSPNPALGEWLELFNGTGSAIDISCFSICDGDFCVTFPPGSIIAAGGYFTIGSSAGSGCGPCDFPGITFDVDWGTCGCATGSLIGTFTNPNEQVALFNSSGTLIDAVIWGGGQGLPTTITAPAIGSCGSTSVTLPSTGSGVYEDIGDPVESESHERTEDGSSSWQMTTSPTPGSTNNPPLPVELISFTGKATGKGNKLEWITASEINNSHFDLARSYDGKSFNTITRVEGNGTTNIQHEYEFLDTDFSHNSKKVYYRLRQFDYDGKMSTATLISVSSANSFGFNAFAEGTKIILNLEEPAAYTLKVELISVTGQVLNSRQIQPGESNQSLDFTGAPGIYFISFQSGNDRYSGKLIVY